ncbi:hypothetical protein P3T37_001058 [Kitasatospora sp. MAA4]|uniref:hypothetical protein n=1 Tax=Kitasatospora sp. MAA4 TaxID=3035093 RepID=UPI00247700BE|nr:hypothetical protein [Kitasatospora sp. MAA4]MDH6131684.1 hypothetical protein [Kitasatospora sp. MAA4]
MFEVRKSIRRFREDPDWVYEKHSTADYAEFDKRGYPFSIEAGDGVLRDVLRGSVAGYPVTLGHVVVRTRPPSRGGALHDFSIAALDLPRALPATAVTYGRLAAKWHADRAWPIPPGVWEQHPLPGGGPGAQVERVCADYEFGEMLITDEIKRLTAAAEIGWRIDRARLIGWTDGRRSYEDLIVLAERLAALVAAFPAATWQWREWS